MNKITSSLDYLDNLEKLSPIHFQEDEIKALIKKYIFGGKIYKKKKKTWQVLDEGLPIKIGKEYRFRFEFLSTFLKPRIGIKRTELIELLKSIGATRHRIVSEYSRSRFWSINQTDVMAL